MTLIKGKWKCKWIKLWRIEDERVFFIFVFFPNISVSPASSKTKSKLQDQHRKALKLHRDGWNLPFSTAFSEVVEKHPVEPSFCFNSGANHHWHGTWGLTISLRWQQIAVMFLSRKVMMSSCWHLKSAVVVFLHDIWKKKTAGKRQFEARTYVEFKPST